MQATGRESRSEAVHLVGGIALTAGEALEAKMREERDTEALKDEN